MALPSLTSFTSYTKIKASEVNGNFTAIYNVLNGQIENANVSASAAIARSKLASGTADHVLINSGAGVMSSEAALAISRGGTGQATAANAFEALSILTTKGDVFARSSTATVRVAAGSDGQVLTADSASTPGVKWATPAAAPSDAREITNLGLAASVAASALTIAMKQSDGSTDPSTGASAVKIGFRSSTATSGGYNQRSVTAALSVVVSSGSTLGHTSGNAHYIYVYALDNAGTVELAVSQTLFPDYSIQSTTAEGGAGAADANNVIYSTTTRSNVPIRLIGRLISTQATAGTWATAPSEVTVATSASCSKELLAATYYLSSNDAPGATTQINYDTKEFDTHNCVTTGAGAWKFTAPVAGVYRVSVTTGYSSGVTSYIMLYKNGSLFRYLNILISTAGKQSGSTLIKLAATDYIDIRPDGTTTLLGDAGYSTSCSIEYVGN